MEFLTLFASVFCLPIAAPHLCGVLVANLSCGNWSLPSFSLSRLLFDSDTKDCASRGISAFRFEARRSVCSRYGPIELISLGFSLSLGDDF